MQDDPDQEDLPDIDYTDPAKRDPDEDDEQMPGLDPIVTVPPEE